MNQSIYTTAAGAGGFVMSLNDFQGTNLILSGIMLVSFGGYLGIIF